MMLSIPVTLMSTLSRRFRLVGKFLVFIIPILFAGRPLALMRSGGFNRFPKPFLEIPSWIAQPGKDSLVLGLIANTLGILRAFNCIGKVEEHPFLRFVLCG